VTTLPIDAITIGDRHRKEMGDLQALADSILARGLLHPVVVTSDHLLVAGHRRLEAVRLLGWTEVPVTVVDVDDLLMAERDENEERKDFTPTEAVAIGRVIEERERPRAEERRRLGREKALAVRAGVAESASPTIAEPQVRDIVAAAVGMGHFKYRQAEEVVAAAEADPDAFGDLPERMDTTGNVNGTHQELARRKIVASPSKAPANGHDGPRHPLLYKTRRIDPNRVVQATVDGAANLMAGSDLYDFPAVDPALIPGWVSSLEESIRFLTTLKRNLNKELTRVQQ
jgi:hypothetical protein